MRQALYNMSDNCNVEDFSYAFNKASENAWEALSDPQEGTILTVFKDLSNFLIEYTNDSHHDDFLPLMNKCLKKAQKSLDNTPMQMQLLKNIRYQNHQQ